MEGDEGEIFGEEVTNVISDSEDKRDGNEICGKMDDDIFLEKYEEKFKTKEKCCGNLEPQFDKKFKGETGGEEEEDNTRIVFCETSFICRTKQEKPLSFLSLSLSLPLSLSFFITHSILFSDPHAWNPTIPHNLSCLTSVYGHTKKQKKLIPLP